MAVFRKTNYEAPRRWPFYRYKVYTSNKCIINRSNIRLLFAYRHNFDMQQHQIDDNIFKKNSCILYSLPEQLMQTKH